MSLVPHKPEHRLRIGTSLLTKLAAFGVDIENKPISRTEWEWIHGDAVRLHRIKVKAARCNDTELRRINAEWAIINRLFKSKLYGYNDYRKPIDVRRLKETDDLKLLVSRCRSYAAVLRALNCNKGNDRIMAFMKNYFAEMHIATDHFIHP